MAPMPVPMDAPAKPSLLAFARETLPEGPKAWRLTARRLQVSAWVFVAAAAWGAAYVVWILLQSGQAVSGDTEFAAVFGIGFVAGGLSMVGFALVFAWWARYSYGYWRRRQRTGYTHAVMLAALLLLAGASSFWDIGDLQGKHWQALVLPVFAAVQLALAVGILVGCSLKSVRAMFEAATPKMQGEPSG